MSNIDFSQVVTAEDKDREAADARVHLIKQECRETILRHISETAQTNISQAVTAYSAIILRGATPEEASISADLTDECFSAANDAWKWISAMQTECRRAIVEADDPVWPPLPDCVPQLVERF